MVGRIGSKLLLVGVFICTVSVLGAVDVDIFYSKYCEHCQYIIDQFLPPILQKYGDRVKVHEYEIEDNLDNYELLLKREAKAGDTDNEIPVIFIGNQVLGGEEEIEKNFVKVLEKELEREKLVAHIGGEEKKSEAVKVETTSVAQPESGKVEVASAESVSAPQEPTRLDTIYLMFFYKQGCTHCDRMNKDIKLLQRQAPQLLHAAIVYREYDIADRQSKLLHEALCERNDVDEEHRLATPAVFLNGAALIYGYNIGGSSYWKMVDTIKALGDTCRNVVLWDSITEEELAAAERRIAARFSKFNVVPIITAGLLDGVNPCAFGALIFFITFLTVAERKKKEILMVGLAYTFAVFVTYYAVGAGFLGFLAALPIFRVIARWVYIITAVLAVGLGVFSLVDFVKAKRGKLSEMTLQLPDKLKKKIHRIIISENEPRKTRRNFLVAAFTTGFFVSLLELACTGQVYLPTIIYVLGIPGLRTKAHLYLLLYNLMFVIPLLVVFIISYLGATSEQLNGFLKKNTAIIKLLTALMFFGMAALLWRTILVG
ncbi:MAG TPA: hypothetical protein ENG11_00845 [candidate division Zixibacteria bacterium]|nr:hypothetical protein [candidate division Zixibacteria bacterium]